ncbi:MAG: hydroxymethylbilane synthase [Actinomycetota bacterium]
MGPPRRLVIASRGSNLALRQAGIVADLVRAAHPAFEIEIRAVTTKGDRDARPYQAIGGKGLFVAEVEREVAEGRCDVAVHSAKDLTTDLEPACSIVCVPRRAAPHDVVVGGSGGVGEERLGSLALGAVVGTSSMRRRALLAELRPDLEVVDLRGNLDTRLRKVGEGAVDAAVLAAAGIERLGEAGNVSTAPLDPERWVPAPAQGALGVEARLDRPDLIELFAGLDDAVARAEVTCERAFAARMEGGCSVPLGCLARVAGDHLVATGFIGHPAGHNALRDRISGGRREAERLGYELAGAILIAGGRELLDELKSVEPPGMDSP